METLKKKEGGEKVQSKIRRDYSGLEKYKNSNDLKKTTTLELVKQEQLWFVAAQHRVDMEDEDAMTQRRCWVATRVFAVGDDDLRHFHREYRDANCFQKELLHHRDINFHSIQRPASAATAGVELPCFARWELSRRIYVIGYPASTLRTPASVSRAQCEGAIALLRICRGSRIRLSGIRKFILF